MTAREDELYSKVIEIATEQAHSQAAQTELHRQNVARQDTMGTLLSAQTTSLLGISNALTHMNEARERSDHEAAKDRQEKADELAAHVSEEIKSRWDRLERKFWIGVIAIVLSGSSDTIIKLLGLFKG